MKNRGSTPIFSNLVGIHTSNIHIKFEANPCSGLREVEKLKKFTPTTMTTTDSLSATNNKMVRASLMTLLGQSKYIKWQNAPNGT